MIQKHHFYHIVSSIKHWQVGFSAVTVLLFCICHTLEYSYSMNFYKWYVNHSSRSGQISGLNKNNGREVLVSHHNRRLRCHLPLLFSLEPCSFLDSSSIASLGRLNTSPWQKLEAKAQSCRHDAPDKIFKHFFLHFSFIVIHWNQNVKCGSEAVCFWSLS